jgi:hypothetical protein
MMTYNCSVCKKSNPDPPFKSLYKLAVCSDICFDIIKRRIRSNQFRFIAVLGASVTWFLLETGNDIGATVAGVCTVAFIVTAWDKSRDSIKIDRDDN